MPHQIINYLHLGLATDSSAKGALLLKSKEVYIISIIQLNPNYLKSMCYPLHSSTG